MLRDDHLDDITAQVFRRNFARANFDPTGGILTAGLALAGGAISAAGTLAGGANAAAMGRARAGAADFQATQDIMNASSERAAAGRRAIETGLKANLTRSQAVANAAAGGVVTTSGSAVTNEAQIVSRGRYATALDLWNGENAATGDLNRAAAAHYTGLMDIAGGEMEKKASYYAAAGTLASAGGTAFKAYGMRNAPNTGYGAGSYG